MIIYYSAMFKGSYVVHLPLSHSFYICCRCKSSNAIIKSWLIVRNSENINRKLWDLKDQLTSVYNLSAFQILSFKSSTTYTLVPLCQHAVSVEIVNFQVVDAVHIARVTAVYKTTQIGIVCPNAKWRLASWIYSGAVTTVVQTSDLCTAPLIARSIAVASVRYGT